MKSEKNILTAFILNLAFSVFEFIGGIYTGSIAVISDSVHDMGDAASIGISYFFEKRSKKSPDGKYTFGYGRYSVLGSLITFLILFCGSLAVIFNAFNRMVFPAPVKYNGMIVFAVIGVAVNFCAAYFTRSGGSLNQRAVNLHMLEDTLGWAAVLAGAVIMKITGISVIDPLMSAVIAIFILIHSVKGLTEILFIFLEKTPDGINTDEIKERIRKIDGITEVDDMRIMTTNGNEIYFSVRIISNRSPEIKEKVRAALCEYGISFSIIEIQTEEEYRSFKKCTHPCCAKKLPFHCGHGHMH